MGKKGETVTPSDAVELALLTPLCELTIVIAQAGQRLTPPLTIPPSLKPFLRFTHKLPMPGLRVVRRIIDSEPDWRARVASAATEALIGEAGMIYVRRPDGWAESFERLVNERSLLADSDGLDKTLRHLERRLAVTEERVRALTTELSETRRDAEERVAHARVEGLASASALKQERERCVVMERDLESAIGARKTADRTVESLRHENDGLREHLALASAEIAALTGRVSELAATPVKHVDVTGVVDAMGHALGHAQQELARLKSALTPLETERTAPKGPTPSKEKRRANQRVLNPSIREPMILPGGLRGDSPEAALYLVKTRGSVVMVDGYNLAKTMWPRGAGGASTLRERLIANLEGIASRTRRPFTVVFDGTSIDSESSPARIIAPQSQITVVYSPAAKEADVVITEMLAGLPVSQSVVVISSDRRVQRLVESMGANVVSSAQFVAAFR
jgi:predicted RNA-binding protein with PIN domain